MDKIREEAETFRREHIFTPDLPVDIEHVIEATKGIRIIPMESLQKHCDMKVLKFGMFNCSQIPIKSRVFLFLSQQEITFTELS